MPRRYGYHPSWRIRNLDQADLGPPSLLPPNRPVLDSRAGESTSHCPKADPHLNAQPTGMTEPLRLSSTHQTLEGNRHYRNYLRAFSAQVRSASSGHRWSWARPAAVYRAIPSMQTQPETRGLKGQRPNGHRFAHSAMDARPESHVNVWPFHELCFLRNRLTQRLGPRGASRSTKKFSRRAKFHCQLPK